MPLKRRKSTLLIARSETLAIGMAGLSAQDDVFLSQRNLYEYRTIIWNFLSLQAELGTGRNADEVQANFQYSFQRLAALNEWVTAGNTLLLINFYPFSVPRFGFPFPLHPPLDGIEFAIAHGKRIEACGSSAVNDWLKTYVPLMTYDVILSGLEFVPFLEVVQANRGNPQHVGGYRRAGDGLLIYLPELGLKKGGEQQFIGNVSLLQSILRPPPAKLPAWADQYRTTEEKHLHDELLAEENLIAQSQGRIAVHRQHLDDHDRLKLLFTATGSQFEEAVADALRELGLAVVVGPNSRADLLASDGLRFAAVEAKGLEGTCREAHLREVGVWMAEVDLAISMSPEERGSDQKAYWSSLNQLPMDSGWADSACKGILVANTFRLLPPPERREPDFPDAMERKIAPMGVCALTGLQLFGLVIEARRHPGKKAEIVRALFETNGVLKRSIDWNAYLTKAANE
jgi:hypothetical protein